MSERLSDEDIIDSIRNTILEGIDETNDYRGPNWEVVARMVYEQHIAGHEPLGREHCEPLHEELKRRFDRIEGLEADLKSATASYRKALDVVEAAKTIRDAPYYGMLRPALDAFDPPIAALTEQGLTHDDERTTDEDRSDADHGTTE